MRIVLFADNLVGLETVRYLKQQGENIVGLYLHPPHMQNLAEEIVAASALEERHVRVASKEWCDVEVSNLKDLRPDVILVVFWAFILPKRVFEVPALGAFNFHMSYLPFNRGKKPNVWPIIDGTPAGVSIHRVDSGIDSGHIVGRIEVPVDICDTAETLYRKQLSVFPRLFERVWPMLKSNEIEYIENIRESGSFHLDKDFSLLDSIDMNKKYYPMEIFNHIRAKTFSPHKPVFFEVGGRRIYVTINLSEEEADNEN